MVMTGIETGAVVGTAVALSLVLAKIINKLVDRLLSKKDTADGVSTIGHCQVNKALAADLSKVPEIQRDILESIKYCSENLKETTKLQRECLRIIDRIELRLENKK